MLLMRCNFHTSSSGYAMHEVVFPRVNFDDWVVDWELDHFIVYSRSE